MSTELTVAQHVIQIANLEGRLAKIEKTLESQDTKLDELIGYASMAKGAGWTIIRVGGWLTAVSAGLWALAAHFRIV